MELAPVIAVKKDVMHSRGLGKLQPLFYSDGTPIADYETEFPRAGDIFVFRDFDRIPDEIVEVRYEVNQRAAHDDSPFFSAYALGDVSNCRLTDRFCDLIDLDDFPGINSTVELDARPSPFFFVRHKETGVIRGPYKRGETVDLGFSGWRVTVINVHPSDSIADRLLVLKERFMLELPESALPPEAIIRCSGLSRFQIDYDRRSFVRADLFFDLAQQDLQNHVVDGMTTEDMLTWARLLLQDQPDITQEEFRHFRELVIRLREHPDYRHVPSELVEGRVKRVVQRLDRAAHIQEIMSTSERSILERFFQTDAGKKWLDQYIQERTPELIEALKAQAERAADKALEEARSRAALERSRMEQELADLMKRVEEIRSQSSEVKRENLTTELQAIREEILQSREEVDTLEQRREDLQRANEHLEEQLQTSATRLKEKIAEFKTFFDVLSGLPRPAEKRSSVAHFALLPATTQPASVRDVTDLVHEAFKRSGRNITYSQAVNYLVSILQSRISIFVGYPGVGKSSAVELLGRALGLQPQGDPQRFLKVNVGRGWVSSRDLVGVFNPLSREFQPSDTGLYHALEALDAEENHGQLPLWVMLDEMNLSPVEHYWSDFLTQADSSQGQVVFGGRPLRFGPALRFIGTVNYDETTETLSPRLISRAHVIFMDPPEVRNMNYVASDRVPTLPGAVSMEALKPIWNAQPAFDDVEEPIFNHLADLLQKETDGGQSLGRPSIIDPRVWLSVQRYCNAARELIKPERGELGALDLAIAQRVLPQCRGRGENYLRRLEKVRALCEQKGLSQSAQTLRRMIENGATYHEYDFFAF